MCPFEEMSTDCTSCAVGVITNGEYKLQVQIVRFTSCSFEEGTCVKIKGRMTFASASDPTFLISSIQDIL